MPNSTPSPPLAGDAPTTPSVPVCSALRHCMRLQGAPNTLHACLLLISPDARDDPHLGLVRPSPAIPPALPLLLWGELQIPPTPRPQSRISLDPRRQHGEGTRGEILSCSGLPTPRRASGPDLSPATASSRGFARRGAIPTHRLAPSRRCYSELRGCRRLFLCRFPLSHLLNKGKRGHRLAVSTHTLISGKGGGGAGGNGRGSPSGGAVTSTGGWSGPGIARGNLERGLHNPQVNKFPMLRAWQPPLRLLRDAWLSPALSEPTAAPQGAAEPECRGQREGKRPEPGRAETGTRP